MKILDMKITGEEKVGEARPSIPWTYRLFYLQIIHILVEEALSYQTPPVTQKGDFWRTGPSAAQYLISFLSLLLYFIINYLFLFSLTSVK